jgi:hypothetical protein
MATFTGAPASALDINAHGIDAAVRRAEQDGLTSRVTFKVVDAGLPLPFADESFDAVFCNDAINHLPGRPSVLVDWFSGPAPGRPPVVHRSHRRHGPADRRRDACAKLDRVLSLHPCRA